MPRQWAVDFVRKLRSQEIPSEGYQHRGRKEWDLGIAVELDKLLDEFKADFLRSLPKPKKPKVLWSGKRWLATKRGRPVFGLRRIPELCLGKGAAQYYLGEKAVRVRVTIERIEEE